MQPPLKAYVIVRKDLSRSQQTVQVGHALAELAFNAGRRKDKNYERWVKEDKTLIVVRARDEDDLEAQHNRIESAGIIHSMFYEPDRGGEATALAVYPGTSEELDPHFNSMSLA
jgi:peptidyl-tRNA hydrolase